MPFDRTCDHLHWTSPKVRLGLHAKFGRALFAAAPIQQGELVMVTGGHIMTVDEHDRLPPHLKHFATHVTSDHLIGRLVDAGEERGEFINHSCDPTCGMDGPLNLVARFDLPIGTELALDYAMCMSSHILDLRCDCGSPKCRGHIRGDDWRRPELQACYRGHFVPYIERWITAGHA
jgi:uncharacterized protein